MYFTGKVIVIVYIFESVIKNQITTAVIKKPIKLFDIFVLFPKLRMNFMQSTQKLVNKKSEQCLNKDTTH